MNDNKIIAEFMELEATPKYNPKEYYVKEYNSGEWYLPEEMQYHTSWDWLMPVINKCLNIYHIEQMNDDLNFTFYDAMGNMEETYQAVVEFIKFNRDEK